MSVVNSFDVVSLYFLFLLPIVPGLGYKSSRILGLEEAFIPELRKVEPIPGMSEANREKLQRRQKAIEEERKTRFQGDQHQQQEQERHHVVRTLCTLLAAVKGKFYWAAIRRLL